MTAIDTAAIKTYLEGLQETLCETFSCYDDAGWREDQWVRDEGGGGRSRVMADGRLIEKAGINISHIRGSSLPASATQHRPELAGCSFEAMGLSLVIHPQNPYVPTAHANVRFFIAEKADAKPIWWFGGGYDLTPYYGNDEDCRHWHQTAKAACEPFSDELYPRFKSACDSYFYLPHRAEARGIGGLFFDDFDELGFDASFALMRSVGDSFIEAYLPIFQRHCDRSFGQRERSFQLYRRGRYVEFNLVQDRGTLFGLQTGGRTESILMSLPPTANWVYNWQPKLGSAEAELYDHYLPPRDWL